MSDVDKSVEHVIASPSDQWVPCSDWLPEPNARVLTYSPGMEEADVGPYAMQWGWMCKRADITHWMTPPAVQNGGHGP